MVKSVAKSKALATISIEVHSESIFLRLCM